MWWEAPADAVQHDDDPRNLRVPRRAHRLADDALEAPTEGEEGQATEAGASTDNHESKETLMAPHQLAKLGALLLLLTIPTAVQADSHLKITCGPEFAIFDRLVPNGRTLNVVPWTENGELKIVATIQMPPGQPQAWAIHDRYVVTRMSNDVYVYRLDQVSQPRLVGSGRIDVERSKGGGTTAIRLQGSVLTVYGVKRTLKLDLATCLEVCEPKPAPAFETPPPVLAPADLLASRRCSVTRNDVLFAESVATTWGNKVLYQDVFLTRRRTNPVGVREVDNPFRPTSVLYVGTRLQTVD